MCLDQIHHPFPPRHSSPSSTIFPPQLHVLAVSVAFSLNTQNPSLCCLYVQGCRTVYWSTGGLLEPPSTRGYIPLASYLPEKTLYETVWLVNKACVSPQSRGKPVSLPLPEILFSIMRFMLRPPSHIWNLFCLCCSAHLTTGPQCCAVQFPCCAHMVPTPGTSL